MRWNGVFLPVKDLALKDCAEAPGNGFAPELVWANLARRAWSFCSRGLRPVVRMKGVGAGGVTGAGAAFATGAGEGFATGAEMVLTAGFAAGLATDFFVAGLGAGLDVDLAMADFLTSYLGSLAGGMMAFMRRYSTA